MSRSARGFVLASLFYLAIGVTMGFVLTIAPVRGFVAQGPGRLLVGVHAHANLVGFVSMMIFGVGYHILPRFSGKAPVPETMATGQLWLTNIGILGSGSSVLLAVMVGTDFFRGSVGGPVITPAMVPYMSAATFFSAILAVSFLLFVYNIVRAVK